MEQTYKGSDELSDSDKRNISSYEKQEAERSARAKKNRKRRLRTRRILTVLFTLLLLLCVTFIFIKTPLFNVESIIIEGNSLVSDEEILASVKMSEGENIFSHSEGYMEKRLMSVPYISEAEVQKKYPSKIVIKVYEEDEFAALEFAGKIISCDKNGKSVNIITPEKKETLMLVKGCNEGEFSLGEYVVLSAEEETDTFYRCLTAIKDYGFAGVSEIDMTDTDDIVFTISGNLILKLGELGNEDELSYKMAYIKEVMDNLPQNISGIIDATNIESGVSYRTGEFEYKTEAEAEVSEEITEGTEAGLEQEEEAGEETE